MKYSRKTLTVKYFSYLKNIIGPIKRNSVVIYLEMKLIRYKF